MQRAHNMFSGVKLDIILEDSSFKYFDRISVPETIIFRLKDSCWVSSGYVWKEEGLLYKILRLGVRFLTRCQNCSLLQIHHSHQL